MKQRKIPMRKDIVTGEMAPKKQLVRIVRNQEQEVSIDPTGKQSGRGAYISLDVAIAKKAKQERTFDHTFGVKIDDQFYDDLIAYVDHQQARRELFNND
ncbi:nucleic-acid-binding protein implicated in transcription termination [Levilactobacillus koreensis JCM 16448]|uniref:DNA-binding protein n=1 Tax=Levilactobacillus koreensis TaxID=637971 RepID=A0AAC9ERB1_9LACO|nr:YlxR family protein [Levilactobacillus koreensis]AKP65641.1 DNA-binding protein [Levilactobacillus koreensis]KRK85734.1 nucleic-acid-binding protein implicated in transcription termination [Levilactobacillus koreensis JCM 16448]